MIKEGTLEHQEGRKYRKSKNLDKYIFLFLLRGFSGDSDAKESACSVGDPGSIPGLGRSPGEGHSNPLQYSCLENSVDRGAWWATVHEVTKSQT